MAESTYVSGWHHGGGQDSKCKMVYLYRGNEIFCNHESHGADRIMFDTKRSVGMEVEIYEIRVHTTEPWHTQVVEATATKTVAVGDKHFAPTASGRAARGELEERVRMVIKGMYAAGDQGIAIVQTFGMQPSTIGSAINAEKPPSDGAIYSILDKWEKSGLAILERKPFRLVGLTDRGRKDLDI
jgi:hypothetical protein